MSSMLLVSSTPTAQAGEISSQYLLGPQDRLTIRVYNLRRNTGEAYSWAALSGEFSIAADGAVSIPLIGQINAAGGTPADLARTIGNSLKKVADLAETPVASVEIAKYRPYFVIGAVQQPGKYDYQPGLTVLQAVSTAEGLVRSSDPRMMQREVVTTRGDLRTLAAERVALASKQARLEAEIAGADAITFGKDLKQSPDKTWADQAMRGEQLLFETRRKSIKAEISAIEQSKSSFRIEINTLNEKSSTLDRQLELSKGELNLVNDLVSKGLSITSRKLVAEQSQASFENSRLDVRVSLLRAQQSLTRAERDIIDLQSKFYREALSEAADTRLKLAQNHEKAQTAVQLAADAETSIIGIADDGSVMLTPRFEVTRRRGDISTTSVVKEDNQVEPGDVLRVTLLRNRDVRSTDTP